MFVKICGLKSAEDVAAAVDAGADAVGFVFTESTRQISIESALELADIVPQRVLRIAVTRHPALALVERILSEFAPDYLQSDAADLAAVELSPGCAPLPVYRNGNVPTSGRLPSRLLFEGVVSGSGEIADWDEAHELARETELILAGGLTPMNVRDAIAYVKPWGVDVSSGVESAPGVKDPSKIEDFVAQARALEPAT